MDLTLDLPQRHHDELMRNMADTFKSYVEGKAKKRRRPLAVPTVEQPTGRLVEVDTGADPRFLVLQGLEYIPAEPEHIGAVPGPEDSPGYPHDCEWDRLYFAVEAGDVKWWFEADFRLSDEARERITEQLAEEFYDKIEAAKVDAEIRGGW